MKQIKNMSQAELGAYIQGYLQEEGIKEEGNRFILIFLTTLG